MSEEVIGGLGTGRAGGAGEEMEVEDKLRYSYQRAH
jgi:hypothetical protein